VIGFDEAQRCILAACPALPAELARLGDAYGRVLAADVHADADLVPYPRSAMDGFAVLAADTATAPLELALAGTEISAGSASTQRHAARTATPIATGGPLPAGADAVIPFEQVTRSNGSIRIAEATTAGRHVFPPGDDARRGDVLARAGTVLAPGLLSLLSAAGCIELQVTRKPRVAIVCTGDELVPLEANPGYGQIRNSNAPLLAAALAELGADIVACETVRDDRAALATRLLAALGEADLLVTTGGASAGVRDFVKPVLREAGVQFAFESVAMRPARPTGFGQHAACAVAVLPGNPAAVFVALHELVRLAVLGLAGRRDVRLPRIATVLEGRLHARGDRTYLPFVRVRREGALLRAQPLDNQCSALTRTAAESNGLAVIAPGSSDAHDGASVEVDVFDWSGV
jgi:molybdopterin molybdotransferase